MCVFHDRLTIYLYAVYLLVLRVECGSDCTSSWSLPVFLRSLKQSFLKALVQGNSEHKFCGDLVCKFEKINLFNDCFLTNCMLSMEIP